VPFSYFGDPYGVSGLGIGGLGGFGALGATVLSGALSPLCGLMPLGYGAVGSALAFDSGTAGIFGLGGLGIVGLPAASISSAFALPSVVGGPLPVVGGHPAVTTAIQGQSQINAVPNQASNVQNLQPSNVQGVQAGQSQVNNVPAGEQGQSQINTVQGQQGSGSQQSQQSLNQGQGALQQSSSSS